MLLFLFKYAMSRGKGVCVSAFCMLLMMHVIYRDFIFMDWSKNRANVHQDTHTHSKRLSKKYYERKITEWKKEIAERMNAHEW